MPNHRWIHAIFGLWFGCALVGAVHAADAGHPSQATYTIDRWNNEKGLPQSSVIAMVQARNGYLWLGTMRGLVRFDGMRFEVFDEGNTPELPSSPIVHLFEDSQSGLWVGTESDGVRLIKHGAVTSPNISRGGRENRLVASCEDATGAVWLYTANGGLHRVRSGGIESMRVQGDRPSFCRALIAESAGLIWVGTDDRQRGLNPGSAFVDGTLPLVTNLPVGKLDFLLASSREGFWRLADGRVQKWVAGRLERDFGSYPWNPLQTPVTSACEDLQGNLVVGTFGGGVYWFDAEGHVDRVSGANGLSHNTVLSLCMDREGSLWVGTDGGGLNRVKRQVFEVQPDSRGKTVQSVCEDGQGGIWFGINGDTLKYWKDGVLKEFGPAQGLLNENVRSVLVDRRQRVWVGTYGGGLFHLSEGAVRFAPTVTMIHPQISVIFEDRAGNIWVGSQGGLARWDGSTWKVFSPDNGLPITAVRALTEDAQGNLWIGTERDGLFRLKDGTFVSYRKSHDGLPSDAITALLSEPDGTLWVGTFGSGLARLRDGKWTRYTRNHGLPSNGVAYLIADDEEHLWLGSNAGLMRAAKKALNDFGEGAIGSVSWRVYGLAEGLPTRECTSGSQPAAWWSKARQLWFPTTQGLVSVDPARLRPNTMPPPVMIEAVLVDDVLQNTNLLRPNWPGEITIPAGKERLEIRYTSLNLGAPDRARFKYQLEGYEKRMADVGEARVASYPNLPPGEYHFRVTACNEDGVWNEEGAMLSVIVEPPFWRTGWFLTVASVVLLGAIVGVVYFVSTQKLQRQLASLRQQEALEKERARIARDLHDQLGANLTQVSLLGEMVETDKALPEEVEAHAKQISQTARETTSALDEIVWAANPCNDTLDSLVTYACKYAQEYLALAGVRYRLDVPEPLPATPLPPDVRHNLFLSFKEAVNNVVKHSKASLVHVRVRLEEGRVAFEIEDDGSGLPTDAAAKGRNGLRNMRKRMEDIGGGFSIGPATPKGTVVRLSASVGEKRL